MHDTTALNPTFLIWITDMIVAEDVSGILLDACPQARVLCAESPESAPPQLTPDCGPLVAIVQMAPEAVRDTPLGQALTRAGARIVLLGNAAEERGQAAGFAVLERPFRSMDLLALIAD
ncbi:hypothetical protein AL036_09845 [Salipiger aestuarii]|uniref:Response regulatory domain-containing protein n=1 Tax=Salipiger aestuarii TaxID=568098 RepID=A0A327Y4L5_9RHOB|nr:hypothetical protein [Salipiger aestuarii]EIE49777.1 hypothetical protein C357_17153 [Citreicella sp. 357]KAA8607623.1 hypothetical protein AL036_09845 [Salipiger aestuarii]KAA8611084.1 hypothetical protein AL037_10450 [Salipiger aestuarii]KAB2541851.1 hypothetical protein AL035_09910 [Salipiger aestuarii]RAK15367.1 hypothetical protein ATI53_102310 [Salipiger aestuarii]